MLSVSQKPWWAAAGLLLVTACSTNDSAGAKPVGQRVEGSPSAGEFTSTAVSDASSLCVNVVDGDQVVQRACVDDATTQSFVLTKAGNGSYAIHTGDGAGCLAVAGTANKSVVSTVACSDVAEQRFALAGQRGMGAQQGVRADVREVPRAHAR